MQIHTRSDPCPFCREPLTLRDTLERDGGGNLDLLHHRKYPDGTCRSCCIADTQKLRLDFRKRYPQTCHASAIFGILQSNFARCDSSAQRALCSALPILTTWDTQVFVHNNRVGIIVDYMTSRPIECRCDAMKGLGQLASVVLDRSVQSWNE